MAEAVLAGRDYGVSNVGGNFVHIVTITTTQNDYSARIRLSDYNCQYAILHAVAHLQGSRTTTTSNSLWVEHTEAPIPTGNINMIAHMTGYNTGGYLNYGASYTPYFMVMNGASGVSNYTVSGEIASRVYNPSLMGAFTLTLSLYGYLHLELQ